MRIQYKPKGVCSRTMDIEAVDGVIVSVNISDGCDGNLQGISRLVEGMTIRDAHDRLKGIRCGRKQTSCPDQLAAALESLLDSEQTT